MISKYAVRDLEKLYDQFHSKLNGVDYYLIDGQHKTASATLTNNLVRVLELENDDDISEIVKKVGRENIMMGVIIPEPGSKLFKLKNFNSLYLYTKYIRKCK
jgi:hypothetical protein